MRIGKTQSIWMAYVSLSAWATGWRTSWSTYRMSSCNSATFRRLLTSFMDNWRATKPCWCWKMRTSEGGSCSATRGWAKIERSMLFQFSANRFLSTSRRISSRPIWSSLLLKSRASPRHRAIGFGNTKDGSLGLQMFAIISSFSVFYLSCLVDRLWFGHSFVSPFFWYLSAQSNVSKITIFYAIKNFSLVL